MTDPRAADPVSVPGARRGSRLRRRLSVAVALAACTGMLSACGPGQPATPLATASLSPAELAAYDDATTAVVAYLQTIADLYSGQRSSLDDLAAVAVPPELEKAQRSVAQALAQGYSSEPVGAQVVLVSAEPYSIELGASPPSVLLKACIDATDLTAVSPIGARRSGVRERQQYRVVQADTIPGAGWAVSEVSQERRARERVC